MENILLTREYARRVITIVKKKKESSRRVIERLFFDDYYFMTDDYYMMTFFFLRAYLDGSPMTINVLTIFFYSQLTILASVKV